MSTDADSDRRLSDACAAFTQWLDRRLTAAGRGDDRNNLDVNPSGLFWLGRLAPLEKVTNSPLGDRGERMEPCAIGIRVRPLDAAPWVFDVEVRCVAWRREGRASDRDWRKTGHAIGSVHIVHTEDDPPESTILVEDVNRALAAELGADVLSVCVRLERTRGRDGHPELLVQVVNTSPEESDDLADTNVYEVEMVVRELQTAPFFLESLPDSFRYDRRVPAYGLNCGVVQHADGSLRSADTIVSDRFRPQYWNVDTPQPDLKFETLAQDPVTSIRQLVEAHSAWGARAWSAAELDRRAAEGSWNEGMRREADRGAEDFRAEAERLADGLRCVEQDEDLRRAFQLANRAIGHAARDKYDAWRPFQIGFLVASLPGVADRTVDVDVADILWFATGGGKTETYLGLLVTAALHDRLTGKSRGITAWSRFPLRLLSLQQTQRFADAMAGAEIARREAGIGGAPISMGFLAGAANTPNKIKLDPGPGEPDPDDESMPSRYRLLMRCPFCSGDVETDFDRTTWRLVHICRNDGCPWPQGPLPVFVVDDEIYRYLPTVIVGTLDKAASMGLQQAMRGLVGAPHGICSDVQHGYVYAPRSKRPNGCLVPGCRGSKIDLPMEASRYGPRFRLQDELHLLRDSLGAVDAHYESLLDHLQEEVSGTRPKIIASSATLTGFERQCDVLYKRRGRVFPALGPLSTESFWSADTSDSLRKFVAISPRGVTLEYAADRLIFELQSTVRRLESDPVGTCGEVGVDPEFAPQLLSLFGTNVVYGNTIRDLDAVERSLETQVPIEPLHVTSLTGQTPFPQVRETLTRLEEPEHAFGDRLHVITASAMMSHGVDIDRLNVMLMLGLPLTTAEFIQATARIGRRRPGLVIVLHRAQRERDAGVFRSFGPFTQQGDRFVDAVPITRRSRRVLERTLPGLILARVLHVHEARAGTALTMVRSLRKYVGQSGLTSEDEYEAVVRMLGMDGSLDVHARRDIEMWMQQFFRNLNLPQGTFRWPSDLSPTGQPMRSLRDVERQAPVQD